MQALRAAFGFCALLLGAGRWSEGPRMPTVDLSRGEISVPLASSAGPEQVPAAMGFILPPLVPPLIVSFIGQVGGSGVTPPTPNGAVGPNHYVQVVNSGIEIWNKSGGVVVASRSTNVLWTGYVGTHAGNGCATRNDGDAVVLYDQLADRWFISQFSLPNVGSDTGPSFQCVAVSRTSDPTGQYWLYDFQYNAPVNDYPKFSVWPDAYYATFNLFTTTAFLGADVCAYDRASMLQGLPATEQCFQQANTVFSLLPASVDGPVKPPAGEPGFFMNLDTSSLNLWKFHVDWATPANSTLTGPTSIPVAAYTIPCPTTARNACVQQPSPGILVSALSDRLMFRLSYRNFGTHESLIVNHTIVANATSGLRWYEVRSPNGPPTMFQQGTYAPNDGNWRWMGSMAQDQARDMALGFSMSSTTLRPSIAWTGRLASDAAGTMGQGEGLITTGAGVTTTDRWGDWNSMTVDPTDDCTFWYTNEVYSSNGSTTWRTQIASFKFANCGANDFSISVAPATRNLQQGGQVAYTITTALTAGTAETIVLNLQDLPSGVSGSFNPTSVTAGSTSTLTLTATVGAPLTGTPAPAFTVIGTAPSALHPATAQVAVVSCAPLTMCPSPDNCGMISDGCGGMIPCGTCTPPETCAGSGTPNVCGLVPDAAVPDAAIDAHGTGGTGGTAGAGGTNGGSGQSGGCGCSTTGSPRDVSVLAAIALVFVFRRRRR